MHTDHCNVTVQDKHMPVLEYTQNVDVKTQRDTTHANAWNTDQCNVTVKDKTYPNPGIHMKH